MVAPLLTALYAGLLGIIALVLALRVVLGRRKYRVPIGDGGHTDMNARIRAFANFAEYVPMILVLIGLCDMLGAPRWSIHALGIALVVGRLAHGWGLSRTTGVSAGRGLGMMLTWVPLLAASLIAIWRAVTSGLL